MHAWSYLCEESSRCGEACVGRMDAPCKVFAGVSVKGPSELHGGPWREMRKILFGPLNY